MLFITLKVLALYLAITWGRSSGRSTMWWAIGAGLFLAGADAASDARHWYLSLVEAIVTIAALWLMLWLIRRFDGVLAYLGCLAAGAFLLLCAIPALF